MRKKIIYASLLCLVAACSSSPAARYYSLMPVGRPSSTALTGNFQLQSVKIPGLLNRPQMVTQLQGNEIALSEYNLWAEPFETMVQRVLAADIKDRSMLDAKKRPAEVKVTIDRFDSDDKGTVTLKASWAIQSAKGAYSGHAFEKTLTVSAGDNDAVINAMSQLLADLADAISNAS